MTKYLNFLVTAAAGAATLAVEVEVVSVAASLEVVGELGEVLEVVVEAGNLEQRAKSRSSSLLMAGDQAKQHLVIALEALVVVQV
jgi:hypothetical protein